MSASELLAHSPKPKRGVGVQTYRLHITNVRERALQNAAAALEHYNGAPEGKDAFRDAVSAAALYHDLGKADEANQIVLRGIAGKGLPVKHEDAGVAALLLLTRTTSAHLVYAHHAGLVELRAARKEKGDQDYLRDNRAITGTTETVLAHSNALLEEYIKRHEAAGLDVLAAAAQPLKMDGFSLRLALSCLVDGDHGDTACHYQQESPLSPPAPRWAERLEALNAYVDRLQKEAKADADNQSDQEKERAELRCRVYAACRDASLPDGVSLRSCDAPVGSGKTTAVMAHLLRVAQARNLRHIIVVLPYTNIIRQSVAVYRKALSLPDEDPNEVVAEHHHLADFGSIGLRHLTTLWKAPIIVTTAVQFFETLASYHPARLRKLHELPGSALFVDEVHATLPTHHWGQVWRWLQDWTTEWGGYGVLASGSLPRFWEINEMASQIGSKGPNGRAYPVPQAPELIEDPKLRAALGTGETSRIRYERIEGNLTLENLLERVGQEPGPRLVIVNTVQSAAVIAREMAKQGRHVLHLSTALAPADRERIVERVYALLGATEYTEWTLVATSCVEAGMNFSFRTGFRQCASAASLIQVGGRVSREAEYGQATVWHFELDTTGSLLSENPGLKSSQNALRELFAADRVNERAPGDLAFDAINAEVGSGQARSAIQALQEAEHVRNYHTVSALARVIATDTRTIVVSARLAKQVENGDKVPHRELQRHSVQIWATKLDANRWPITHIAGEKGTFDALYRWTGEYDPDFLGYMAGVLAQDDLLKEGSIIV